MNENDEIEAEAVRAFKAVLEEAQGGTGAPENEAEAVRAHHGHSKGQCTPELLPDRARETAVRNTYSCLLGIASMPVAARDWSVPENVIVPLWRNRETKFSRALLLRLISTETDLTPYTILEGQPLSRLRRRLTPSRDRVVRSLNRLRL